MPWPLGVYALGGLLTVSMDAWWAGAYKERNSSFRESQAVTEHSRAAVQFKRTVALRLA